MTSLKTSIKTITYLSDIGCLEIQGASLFLQLLDRVSPSQWAAIGVLGSLLFGLLTYLTNLYFKIREDRR
ncbi:class II holin family protein, partial [Escherichia coli]|uniref:class II holin family protein n=1 Tax=Escherichia coli TaxID=562 RepID=UPI003006CC35